MGPGTPLWGWGPPRGAEAPPGPAGILEVLYCVLIESPEVLNIIQENHIKSIISLLDKHGRNHKVGRARARARPHTRVHGGHTCVQGHAHARSHTRVCKATRVCARSHLRVQGHACARRSHVIVQGHTCACKVTCVCKITHVRGHTCMEVTHAWRSHV